MKRIRLLPWINTKRPIYILLLAAFVFMNMPGSAQSGYTRTEEPESGVVIFNGLCSFADIQNEPSCSWLEQGRKAYKPNPDELQLLEKRLPQYELVILMGTWCEDSQHLLPEIYKVLEDIHYPMQQLRMYGLDRSKQTTGNEHTRYNVTFVPTIIILKDGVETGRIVETVQTSIESDLTAIINGIRQ